MREITSYQAFDGKVFTSKQECLDYEQDHLAYREVLSVYVKFLDNDRKELCMPASKDCYYEQNLEDAYNKSAFLIIEDDFEEDIAAQLYEEMGISIPYKRGQYRYDEYEGWVKLTDDLIAFCKRWNMTVREMIKRFTP